MAAAQSQGTPHRRGPSFFRVLRFDKTVRGSENAVVYVAFKSKDVQDREPVLFSKTSDHADVRSFMDRLDDPLTRHPMAAKSYHCLFSLRRKDFDLMGVPNWKEIVREVMGNYERETGRRLDWIASHHDNPDHPHCHIIIRATYDTPSGQHRRLRLDKREVQRIKDQLSRSLEARGLTPERMWSPTREYARPNIGSNINGVLSWLQQQIRSEQRRRAYEEAERNRRWLEEKEREQREHDR